jgi:monoamine oxidase
MSRSLFARLNRKYGPRVDGATRREFLMTTLAASAGLLLSRDLVLAQAAGTPAKKVNKSVAVIGAGFAGLAAAHELLAAGYDVSVIEARDRLGGRVLSFADLVPGKNVEGGGELIGSNHPMWVAYAQQFGLEFLDVTESEDAAPIYIDGKRLSEDEEEKLWEEMDKVLQRMNADAAKVDADQPWLTPDAAALDKRTCADWINAQKDVSDLCRKGCWVQQAADNGQDPARQSYLGNLTQIKGGGVEAYWTESEVYRCKGGNQQLATLLAEKIGKDRIILGLPVSAIEARGRDNKMVVTCRDGRTIEVDDVVLAVPPSTWKKIRFNPGLPGILDPQMGVNVKYLAGLKKRFWKDLSLAPDSLTDDFLSMTWEGTDGQEGDEGASLNCFSGGPAAAKALAMSKAERDRAYADMLNKIYAGYNDNVAKTRFMDWPNDQWTMAGYSFPAPGQVTTVGPILHKGIGRLHFAGEHASYKFVGYMEGALNSGASLAQRIAKRDGIIRQLPTPKPVSKPDAEATTKATESAKPLKEAPEKQEEKREKEPALVK